MAKSPARSFWSRLSGSAHADPSPAAAPPRVAPATPAAPAPRAHDGDGLTFTSVWRNPSAEVGASAKALWAATGILPAGVDPDERVAQLCVVGHLNGMLVALTSAEINEFALVRQRFAFLRIMILPRFRSFPRVLALARAAHGSLEAWAAAHPEEEVMGMATVIESRIGAAAGEAPCWPMRQDGPPTSGLVLAAYNDAGDQVRISWFGHARITPPPSPSAADLVAPPGEAD
ncbi:MAG TPA: hypothetical protein VG248_18615 [Caulobacteraceae bacterium]|jgi:hypothetical protein|nr:hypothetical protein [Caulobacteraceae bacterium]